MRADSLNSSCSTSDSKPASSPPRFSAFLSSSLSSPHSWPHRCSSGSTDGTARILRTIRRSLSARGPCLPRRADAQRFGPRPGGPPLLGVTNGLEGLVHPNQRLVENLHLFSALFVGRLGCASGTFGLDARRTLAAYQAEVLL